MDRRGSGRTVLHFAVTGALLGGGVASGCTSKDGPKTNTAHVDEPGAEAGQLHINPGPDKPKPDPQPPTEDRVNVGPEDEPKPPPEEKRVNVGPEDDAQKPLDKAPPDVSVNPGPEPQPKPEPAPIIKTNPGPTPEKPK
ncbi:MAG: hypothetical protein AAF799_05665 [Myxococcota bacterium]